MGFCDQRAPGVFKDLMDIPGHSSFWVARRALHRLLVCWVELSPALPFLPIGKNESPRQYLKGEVASSWQVHRIFSHSFYTN